MAVSREMLCNSNILIRSAYLWFGSKSEKSPYFLRFRKVGGDTSSFIGSRLLVLDAGT
jgi:hypothetical protein